jgi:predicted NUDIX family NTP pyrophosphohydrolase
MPSLSGAPFKGNPSLSAAPIKGKPALSPAPVKRKPALSAGILLFRRPPSGLELLIAHMGGPFWNGREEGAWSFPKGGVEAGETVVDAALREFREETGLPVPLGPLLDLGELRTNSTKIVHLWALEGEVQLDAFSPGTFELEWPPHSGRVLAVPEVDRVRWASPGDAERLLVKGQRPFVGRLLGLLREDAPSA